ncbi:hypothetical protein [Wansuia hejianensis]|uniref:Uncharacterized protein n=1 Tax=Wansuia hejianensis TaxID=2763667 RepID=A0A926F3E0_9FIRM|nr:hypothetical protein [Wansuia hejianensis]MBC8591169.1 hypothetical protein [Wansuia hejianensis]
MPGNKRRVSDGRRISGFIEKYDDESAMFIWRITDFKDKGKYQQKKNTRRRIGL